MQNITLAGKVVGWVGMSALTLAPCSTSKVTVWMQPCLRATRSGVNVSRFGLAPAFRSMVVASILLFMTAKYRAVLRRSSYIIEQSSDNMALTSKPASISSSRISFLLRSAAKWRGLIPVRLTLALLVAGISMDMILKMRNVVLLRVILLVYTKILLNARLEFDTIRVKLPLWDGKIIP